MDVFLPISGLFSSFHGVQILVVINPATDDDAIAKQVIQLALHFVLYDNKMYRKSHRRSEFQRSSWLAAKNVVSNLKWSQNVEIMLYTYSSS